MSVRAVDIDKIRKVVDRCCKTDAECGECVKVHCLIGFCQTVLNYCRQKQSYTIPQGYRFIPRSDFRAYYQKDLIRAVVEVLLQCQNCRDNHEEDCVINIIRSSLELALLGENIPYDGSAFGYLIKVNSKNPEVGSVLLQEYQQKKDKDQ